MPKQEFEIRSFPTKSASQMEYAALNRHINRMRLERLPNDPPIPVDETVSNMKSLPPFVDVRLWAAWDAQGEMAALGNVVLMRTEENQHVTQFDITVLPEYRQQGLARRLLRLVADAAQEDHRRLLIGDTTDRVQGGEIFMNRLGAQKGLETHTNQLIIAELKPGLLDDWLVRSEPLNQEFELGLWDGAYPEDKIQAIADLCELTNQQPLGDLEIEDMHITPEQLRQSEQNMFARGSQRWTFYLVDRATGQFAGYTETVWNPNRPEILSQDMTGVFPQYRGRGLGRWLKAAMLDKVLKERPQIKYVRTGNADSNAAMLKINTELGFKPYIAGTLWQVEIQKVMEYLQARGL